MICTIIIFEYQQGTVHQFSSTPNQVRTGSRTAPSQIIPDNPSLPTPADLSIVSPPNSTSSWGSTIYFMDDPEVRS